jgi:thymidylate synthase
MKLEFIEATDIADGWFQALIRIFDFGREYIINRGSYAGQKRLEFDYVTIRIKYPSTRPLLPKIPAHLGIPDPVADDYLDQYLPYLLTDAKREGEFYTYGQRLNNFDGVNQIQSVINMYRKEGYGTNQACMEVGAPIDISLDDPACLRIIDTRIIDNKLNFIVYFRSNDLWSGFPANIAGLQLVKEYMASEIGVADGEILYASKGLHLYDHVWDIAKIRIGRS